MNNPAYFPGSVMDIKLFIHLTEDELRELLHFQDPNSSLTRRLRNELREAKLAAQWLHTRESLARDVRIFTDEHGGKIQLIPNQRKITPLAFRGTLPKQKITTTKTKVKQKLRRAKKIALTMTQDERQKMIELLKNELNKLDKK